MTAESTCRWRRVKDETWRTEFLSGCGHKAVFHKDEDYSPFGTPTATHDFGPYCRYCGGRIRDHGATS